MLGSYGTRREAPEACFSETEKSKTEVGGGSYETGGDGFERTNVDSGGKKLRRIRRKIFRGSHGRFGAGPQLFAPCRLPRQLRRVLSSPLCTDDDTSALGGQDIGVFAHDSVEGGARVTGIEEWLQQLGLEKYGAVFAEHEITLEVLPDLTEPDIDRLALPTGPRRRLMLAIQALGAAAHAQSSVPSPETP